jgi:CRP-like cAMP-binding protein
MVKVNLSDINVPELIADIWSPLNDEQREFLANHFTLQNYKKNEVIHCEGETPTHLMCLLSGKVKIYKDGVGGRSQIIRSVTALTLQKQTMSRQHLHSSRLLFAKSP